MDDMIPYSAYYESEIQSGAPDDESMQAELAQECGKKQAINQIIKRGYQKLGIKHFFTANDKDAKCWTIRDGTTAQEAAGVMDRDSEERFVNAEVTDYDVLKEHDSIGSIKKKGLMRQEGKDYLVKEGDILNFKIAMKKS